MYAHTHIRIGTSQISSVPHTLVPICTPVCHFAVYMYRSILVQTKPVFHWPDGKAWQLHWKGPIRRGLAASPRTTCFAIACLQCNKQCGHLHHVVSSWCRSPAARHCTHYTTFKSSHFFFYETCILWEQASLILVVRSDATKHFVGLDQICHRLGQLARIQVRHSQSMAYGSQIRYL